MTLQIIFPNGKTDIVEIDSAQEDILWWLKDNGALAQDFSFEEICIKHLC